MILGQQSDLYPFDDLVEAGESAGGDWNPPSLVDKALDWLKTKTDPIATDIEKRAAAAGAEGAKQAGVEVETRIRTGLEPVERSAKTMTYVLVGVGAVVVAATGVLIWQSTKKSRRGRK